MKYVYEFYLWTPTRNPPMASLKQATMVVFYNVRNDANCENYRVHLVLHIYGSV